MRWLLISASDTLLICVFHRYACCCAGNGGSLEKCRRRWDLADAEFLKYKFMNEFDRAMNHLDKAFSFSNAQHQWVSRKVCTSPLSDVIHYGCFLPFLHTIGYFVITENNMGVDWTIYYILRLAILWPG